MRSSRRSALLEVAIVCSTMLAIATCAHSLPAQVSRVGATIEGIARDTSGGALSKISITIQNEMTGQTRIVTTDDQGLFRAEELTAGCYQIRAQQAGFQLYRQTNLQLPLGQTVHVDILLAPAGTTEEVTVTAAPSGLDTSQTAVVSSVDQERIEELPVRSRNYLDFVLLAPGVSSAPTPSATNGGNPPAVGGFTFGGLRPQSNSVAIDGLDNNDRFTGASRIELSPEIVQEFQVVNNGLSAESGGASGGSINVITRSGTNTFHGDAFLFAQNSATNARDPFETDPSKPEFERYREGFALGGPIVKEKTLFYVAAEQEESRGQIGSDIAPATVNGINTLLATGAYPNFPVRQITTGFSPTSYQETEAAGKLDHQLTSSTSLMVRYAYTNARSSGDAFDAGGVEDASSNGTDFTKDEDLSGALTTVYGQQAVGALRFQAATRQVMLRTAETIGPEIDIAGLASFGRAFAGNSRRRENDFQANYTYSRIHNKHSWKVGATVNDTALRAALPNGFGGLFLFGSLEDFLAGRADQFRQTFGNPNVDLPVQSFGAFVQDHWSVAPKLTLDLGVRYDFEHLPSGFHEDGNNIAPRIGIAWNPRSKLVLRAGYGVFFDRYVLAELAQAVEINGTRAFQQVADGNAATAIFAASGGAGLAAPANNVAPSIFQPSPNLSTPYSEQASAGAEYLIARNLTAQIDYRFVYGSNLPRTLNVNLLPPTVLTNANAAGLGVPPPTPQQIGRPVFSPARANPAFDDIYQLQDAARSTYNGVSFAVSRKMNEDLEFSGSYTLSRTFDNASDYNEQPQNPFALAAEYAPSRQNQLERFVFNALWDLPIGDEDEDQGKNSPKNEGWLERTFQHIELAPIFLAQSGYSVEPLTGLDSNESHAFPLSARPLGFGRNSITMPATVTMDLRALKYFPFGGVRRLDVVAEFFNLLNRANVSQINPVYGSGLTPMADFEQPIEGTGARRVQFSLDFEF